MANLSKTRNPKVIDLLSDAVQSVLDSQANGVSAVDAMVKTASAMSLSPEQINRVVHILNRSSLNSQRLYTGDLNSKLADAEIIDPKEVVRRVYKMEDKTAAAPEETIYDRMRAKIAALPPAVKAMEVVADKTAGLPTLKLPVNPGHGLYHGLTGVELVETQSRWRNQRKEAQLELSRLYSKAQQELDAITHKLSSYPMNVQPEIINQSKFHFEETNPQAKCIVMHLADNLPAELQAKVAGVPEVPETWLPQLFRDGFVSRVEKLAAYLLAIPGKAEELQRKIAESDAHLELIDSSCVNGRVVRVGINPLGLFVDKDKAWIEKKIASALFAGATVYNAAQNKNKDKAKGPTDEERYMLQLKNPQHEAALGSVRTRAALQELIATDPVIKSFKPAQVVSAFNELSQYSPKAVEHTAALRAGLRSVLQNNTSLFDLDQLRKTERS